MSRRSDHDHHSGLTRHLLRLLGREVGLWRRRAEERRELARLTEVERRDIGITRTDAWVEANKPCWRE